MTVIVKAKSTVYCVAYNSVSNIAYNSSTKTVTLTYGSGSTTTVNLDSYWIIIQDA